jgi:hypothetical protein
MTFQFVIANHPENQEYVNVTESGVTLTIPKGVLYELSKALADFEV